MATTKYGAIADALRARIADGTYPVGTKLPSITELMREFDVPGLNTVRDAQQVLGSSPLGWCTRLILRLGVSLRP